MQKSSSLIVEVNGRRYTVAAEDRDNLDIVPVDRQTYHILEGHTSHDIRVLHFDLAGRSCLLRIDGEIREVRFLRELDLLIEEMGLNSSRARASAVLLSPMPGLVTDIRVVPGQEVEAGTQLLILEAMKMENVITAPFSATIKEVSVAIGQAVEKGAGLIEFEKTDGNR